MTGFASLVFVAVAAQVKPATPAPSLPASSWQKEVFYQIFPISFRDSNGDGFGDFKGIQNELPFLKKLGITTILVNPIFKSRFYHKYFADDFMTVDPVFGANADWFDLVRATHRDGLKVVLDMEVQYVADNHPWFRAAKNDPQSPFAAYLWKNPGIYTSAPIPGYDGQKIQAAAVNTDNPDVRTAIENVFAYWAKPDGDADAGVDGFRIDHMMDDFDGMHVKRNMLTGFWLPIIRKIRSIRPGEFFVGEQSDWGTGASLFRQADVDAVFDFAPWLALKDKRHAKLTQALAAAPPPKGKTRLDFIEIHDTERFASLVHGDPRAIRMGAVLEFTLRGTPLIYQGQELGMRGKQAVGKTDANDIPQRLGYRWSKRVNAPGTPRWYVGHVPASTLAYSRTGDGISLEEERNDPASLLNFYRRLIRLRQGKPALQTGSQMLIPLGKTDIVALERSLPGHRPIWVILNPSAHAEKIPLPGKSEGRKTLIGSGRITRQAGGQTVHLSAYGYWVFETS